MHEKKLQGILRCLLFGVVCYCFLFRKTQGAITNFRAIMFYPTAFILSASFLVLVQPQATWLSGNDTAYVPGVYGTKGVPSINNYPGGRSDHSLVIDEILNCLYVFGGYGESE